MRFVLYYFFFTFVAFVSLYVDSSSEATIAPTALVFQSFIFPLKKVCATKTIRLWENSWCPKYLPLIKHQNLSYCTHRWCCNNQVSVFSHIRSSMALWRRLILYFLNQLVLRCGSFNQSERKFWYAISFRFLWALDFIIKNVHF